MSQSQTITGYAAAHFRGETGRWRDILARAPFALVSHHQADGTTLASWVPLLARDQAVDQIEGHLARINPLARALRQSGMDGLPVQVAILGAHGYISPRWYSGDTPAVPTWNYEAAYLTGCAVAISEPQPAEAIVTRLADAFEPEVDATGSPWRFDQQPAAFRDAMIKGITAFTLTVTREEVTQKLSQNRPERDQSGVVAGLLASRRGEDQSLGRLMAAHLGETDGCPSWDE